MASLTASTWCNDREDGEATFWGKSTGRAVLFSALTTIVGFSAQMIGKHRGIFSLGLIMTLGVTTCLISSMTLLPPPPSRNSSGSVGGKLSCGSL